VQNVLLRLFEKAGDPGEAARRRAEYAKQRPDIGWLDQAINDARQGRTEEAVRGFRRVIEFNPSHSAAWANLGGYYQRTGNLDSALMCLKVADGLTPHDAHVQHNLGIVYYSMKKYDRAEQHWKEAIRLNPDNFNSRDLLLKLYKQEGRTQDYLELSFEMFEIGARQDAPLPFVQKMAELFLQRGDYANAAANYKRALAKGLDTSVVRDLESRYPNLHVLNDGQ